MIPTSPHTQPDEQLARAALQKEVDNLEIEIATLKSQWPKHSVPPALLIQLEDLEEALEQAQAQIDAWDNV